MLVLVAGHCCVDITPELGGSIPGVSPGILYPVGELKFKVGGSAPNTGRALSILGTNVQLAVAIGDDELGSICKSQLEATGIPIKLIMSNQASSYSIVVEHGSHDRTFWQHEGSNAAFDPRLLDLDAPRPAMLHVGYPSLLPLTCAEPQAIATSFSQAKQRDITTSLDLAHVGEGSIADQVDWESWFKLTLPRTDICSPSWDDITSALGIPESPTRTSIESVADQLIEWGAAVVTLSAGSLGFILKTAPKSRILEAGRVFSGQEDAWSDATFWFDADHIEHPLTTVGAGDALTAGLLNGVVNRLRPEAAGQHARQVVWRHLHGKLL